MKKLLFVFILLLSQAAGASPVISGSSAMMFYNRLAGSSVTSIGSRKILLLDSAQNITFWCDSLTSTCDIDDPGHILPPAKLNAYGDYSYDRMLQLSGPAALTVYQNLTPNLIRVNATGDWSFDLDYVDQYGEYITFGSGTNASNSKFEIGITYCYMPGC